MKNKMVLISLAIVLLIGTMIELLTTCGSSELTAAPPMPDQQDQVAEEMGPELPPAMFLLNSTTVCHRQDASMSILLQDRQTVIGEYVCTDSAELAGPPDLRSN